MSWQTDPVIHDSILFNTVDGEGGGPALCSDTHKVMFCVGWFFDFVITSSCRFFERFKIQESPVLGQTGSFIFWEPLVKSLKYLVIAHWFFLWKRDLHDTGYDQCWWVIIFQIGPKDMNRTYLFYKKEYPDNFNFFFVKLIMHPWQFCVHCCLCICWFSNSWYPLDMNKDYLE